MTTDELKAAYVADLAQLKGKLAWALMTAQQQARANAIVQDLSDATQDQLNRLLAHYTQVLEAALMQTKQTLPTLTSAQKAILASRGIDYDKIVSAAGQQAPGALPSNWQQWVTLLLQIVAILFPVAKTAGVKTGATAACSDHDLMMQDAIMCSLQAAADATMCLEQPIQPC